MVHKRVLILKGGNDKKNQQLFSQVDFILLIDSPIDVKLGFNF